MGHSISSLDPGDFLRSPSPPLRDSSYAWQYCSMAWRVDQVAIAVEISLDGVRRWDDEELLRSHRLPSSERNFHREDVLLFGRCDLVAQGSGPRRLWWPFMGSPASREHVRRMRIRLAALRRHEAARDPATGKSALAVAAGQDSGRKREGDRAWGLEWALKRWYPITEHEKDSRGNGSDASE